MQTAVAFITGTCCTSDTAEWAELVTVFHCICNPPSLASMHNKWVPHGGVDEPPTIWHGTFALMPKEIPAEIILPACGSGLGCGSRSHHWSLVMVCSNGFHISFEIAQPLGDLVVTPQGLTGETDNPSSFPEHASDAHWCIRSHAITANMTAEG